MTSLKVYVDLMSQPCRALMMFLRSTSIPFEQKLIAIAKQEHKTPEFKKIHKFGKLPAITDGGVNIIESIAILKYLTRKYQEHVPDHWYPRDLVGQARVDEFLEWHHIGLRVPLASYFATEFLTPMFTGKPADPAKLAKLRGPAEEALDNVENSWLNETSYVAGSQISVADLIGLCEIEQLLLTTVDPFQGRPRLTEWAKKLRSELGPNYTEVHKIFNKVVAKQGKL